MTMFRTALNNKSLRHASVTKVTGALQRNLTFKNFFHRVLACGTNRNIIEHQSLVVVGFAYRPFFDWTAQRPGTDFFSFFSPFLNHCQLIAPDQRNDKDSSACVRSFQVTAQGPCSFLNFFSIHDCPGTYDLTPIDPGRCMETNRIRLAERSTAARPLQRS